MYFEVHLFKTLGSLVCHLPSAQHVYYCAATSSLHRKECSPSQVKMPPISMDFGLLAYNIIVCVVSVLYRLPSHFGVT